ncbi:uncharacterized protein LOC125859113 [Solanum stenotomum]|uniref:uncharacterized protein LOC125859113 n=1 Tax=Solanum stenotomum TaxID=172797 RepID=UPI0020D1BD4E|nr:uncharacterized protein LOC125859113 [Solanum stenotomum]
MVAQTEKADMEVASVGMVAARPPAAGCDLPLLLRWWRGVAPVGDGGVAPVRDSGDGRRWGFIFIVVVPRGTATPVLLKWFVSRDVPTGALFSNGTIIPIPIPSFPLLVYLHSRKFIRSADGAKSGILHAIGQRSLSGRREGKAKHFGLTGMSNDEMRR